MGNQNSQPSARNIDYSKFSHFLPAEIKEWSSMFKSVYPDNRMSLDDFIDFFSSLFPFGNVKPFCSRLFQNINISQAEEIELGEFLIAFTILLKGSTFERLRWLFRFYDQDKDGFVSKNELKEGLDVINLMIDDSSLTPIPTEEVVNMIFSTLENHSGFLTFNDFEMLAQQNMENLVKVSFFFDL
jgi:Ca2+-binding EF-hand superfamily protein